MKTKESKDVALEERLENKKSRWRVRDVVVAGAAGVGFLSGAVMAGYGIATRSDETAKAGMYTMFCSMGVAIAYSFGMNSSEDE